MLDVKYLSFEYNSKYFCSLTPLQLWVSWIGTIAVVRRWMKEPFTKCVVFIGGRENGYNIIFSRIPSPHGLFYFIIATVGVPDLTSYKNLGQVMLLLGFLKGWYYKHLLSPSPNKYKKEITYTIIHGYFGCSFSMFELRHNCIFFMKHKLKPKDRICWMRHDHVILEASIFIFC